MRPPKICIASLTWKAGCVVIFYFAEKISTLIYMLKLLCSSWKKVKFMKSIAQTLSTPPHNRTVLNSIEELISSFFYSVFVSNSIALTMNLVVYAMQMYYVFFTNPIALMMNLVVNYIVAIAYNFLLLN